MHLFTNYIQPLTFWLYAHPHLALFITFLISFGESLAIVGSIIPGSVTMTAIGILAGSGVMRIDLTYLAAILGAIAGDGGSYALGYTFSDRLTNIWPFCNYPRWLSYGQDYFARHGATSVLIGRFVGPMRSIIPVIAGMMHMSHWRFFFANTISAIGWAILYVTPGVLIGAASSELSTESSTRLFVLIFILLVVTWLTSIGLRWLFVNTNQFLRKNLHCFWIRLKNQPGLTYLTNFLAPYNEINHYKTAALVILTLFGFCISIITIALVIQGTWVSSINNPVYLFFQSLRTQPFDSFFITISLAIGPLSLITLLLTIFIHALYTRDWRILRYWLSLGLTSVIAVLLLTTFVGIPTPVGLSSYHNLVLFPDIDLTLATSLIGFLILYSSTHHQTTIILTLRILLLALLSLAGIALLYLGDNWITTVLASYFIGLTFCFIHWIVYRRTPENDRQSQLPIILFCALLTVATYFSYLLYFKENSRAHSFHVAQYVITDQVWWNQQKPLLPIYSTNRIGKPTNLLNIQYVGPIKKLQQTLETAGWKQQPDSFLYLLLMRVGGHNSAELPLLAQLYQNRKPTLVITYSPPNTKIIIVLRLWRSNYHLRHYRQPIWLGSVNRLADSKSLRSKGNGQHVNQPLLSGTDYLLQAIHNYFKSNTIKLSNQWIRLVPHHDSSMLLLIKESDDDSKT